MRLAKRMSIERHFWLNKYSMYWEQYGLKDFSYLQDTEVEVEEEQ